MLVEVDSFAVRCPDQDANTKDEGMNEDDSQEDHPSGTPVVDADDSVQAYDEFPRTLAFVEPRTTTASEIDGRNASNKRRLLASEVIESELNKRQRQKVDMDDV